jgi:hypothetical protein
MKAMDEPKKKILEMVASGKISVDEAAALLDRVAEVVPGPRQIEGPGGAEQEETPKAPPRLPQASGRTASRRPRYLRVNVESSEGDEVNVRLPLALIKTGIKLGSLLPKEASSAIDRSGVDLSKLAELEGDELLEALSELQVHVESSDGDEVHVYCE